LITILEFGGKNLFLAKYRRDFKGILISLNLHSIYDIILMYVIFYVEVINARPICWHSASDFVYIITVLSIK